MRVNVVTVTSGWILQKMAERIGAAGNMAGHDFVVGTARGFGPSAVNFYCDIQNCFHAKTMGLDIGFFTHVHENSPRNIKPHWLELDFIFHMSSKYVRMFEEAGYPLSQMAIMRPHERIVPRKRVGVFQRGKYEGKGFHFMRSVIGEMADTEFFLVGSGWEEYEGLGNVRVFSDDKISYPSGYQDLYRLVDVVLIPSLWEGGPMAFYEALDMGKPVVSSDVGFVRDIVDVAESMLLPTDRVHIFHPGDVDGCVDGLDAVCRKNGAEQRRIVNSSIMTYEDAALDIVEAARELGAQ